MSLSPEQSRRLAAARAREAQDQGELERLASESFAAWVATQVARPDCCAYAEHPSQFDGPAGPTCHCGKPSALECGLCADYAEARG